MFVSPRIKRATLIVPLFVALFSMLAGSAFGQHFNRTDLTSNQSGIAPNMDPNLVNAWGLARSSGSPWWVSDNGKGLSTLYDGSGVPQSLVVTIPPPKGQEGPSAPTGAVFNFTSDFNLEPGLKAIFIFATEDGTISGWNPTLDLLNARRRIDHFGKAIYKGIALATPRQGSRIFVSNFMSGQVEVYNGKWQRVATSPTAFVDPTLPANYVPFGIQNVGGNIVVTFAHREPGSLDEDHGPGLGYVTIFNTNGEVVARLKHGDYFNAPWGIAMSGADFGAFSHRLLIGNFGDGQIHAFDPLTGNLAGTLLDSAGNPIWIDGLWALEFGGGNSNSGAASELFFTAGPDDESNGLFGKLAAVSNEQRGSSE